MPVALGRDEVIAFLVWRGDDVLEYVSYVVCSTGEMGAGRVLVGRGGGLGARDMA